MQKYWIFPQLRRISFQSALFFFLQLLYWYSLQTNVGGITRAQFDIFNRTVIKNRGHVIVISISTSISKREASKYKACPSNSTSPNANIDLTLIVCCSASSKFRRIHRYICYVCVSTSMYEEGREWGSI